MAAAVFMAYGALIWFGRDFRGYYAAARLLLDGGNPYDYHALAPVLLEVTGRVGNSPYYYPLWFAWLISPLVLLPFETARLAWMVFNCALWCLSLWQLGRILGTPPAGWRRALWNLFATLTFAWFAWRYESTGVILFALMVGMLAAYRHQSWLTLGLCMALWLVKPNITLAPVVVISFWLLIRRRWQPVIACIALSGLLWGITTVATPDWYKPWLKPGFSQGLVSAQDGPERVLGARVTTTIADWLLYGPARYQLRPGQYAILVAIGLVLAGQAARRASTFTAITVFCVLFTFALTPYALQYDYPPLVLALFCGADLRGQSPAQRAISIALIVFVASVPFWERPISDGYWILLGLIALTAWSAWCRSRSAAIGSRSNPSQAAATW